MEQYCDDSRQSFVQLCLVEYDRQPAIIVLLLSNAEHANNAIF